MSLPIMFLPWPAFAQIAGSLLNPLVAAWIRSEVESVDNLQVQILGSDAQILNGQIPQAQVAGDNLSYQGFQVSQLQIRGQDIRLNVNEAIQGRSPLRLLAPVPVQVSLRLTEDDLNRTLQAPLIQSQLAEAQVQLPFGDQSVPFLINQPKVTLEQGRVRIQANLITPEGTEVPVTVLTGLQAHNQNQLLLVNPVWVSGSEEIPVPGLADFPIQLDAGVRIDRLELQIGQILYEGMLTIYPEAVPLG
ncbi:MAG: LmeA family phospholipid-binding protein [Cyanobacteriota bacterium]